MQTLCASFQAVRVSNRAVRYMIPAERCEGSCTTKAPSELPNTSLELPNTSLEHAEKDPAPPAMQLAENSEHGDLARNLEAHTTSQVPDFLV